jgi:hypothetical protein
VITFDDPLGLPGFDGIGGSTVRLAERLIEPPAPLQVIVTVLEEGCCDSGPVLLVGTEFPLVPTQEVALLLE